VGIVAAGCIVFNATSFAGTTQSFEIDDAASFAAGDLEAAAVFSEGSVAPSAAARRVALDDISLAYSMVRGADGSIFIGTGRSGKIYKFAGGKASLFASTQQLLVTSLALGKDGTLYAGTSPKGHIFKVDAAGTATKWVTPEGAGHIWALVYDAKRNVLYAGAGPQGKVFAIGSQGKAEVYFKSKQPHIMSLALDQDGSLLAGTSEQALLLRIRGPGRAEVVYNFPGNEITSIDAHGGTIAVASNNFNKSGTAFSAMGYESTTIFPASPPGKKPAGSKTGAGELWRVDSDGRAERVYQDKNSYFASVQIGKDGSIYGGLGQDGRIVEVTPELRNAIWVDIDERQILAMDLRGNQPVFVTGDPGALYLVDPTAAKASTWMSEVLDAQFQSHWGNITWRAQGAITFQTRSGNTRKPDETWSDWSSASTQPGAVRSPGARFIQVRATFPKGKPSTLHALSLYYLPRNQRAQISQVEAKTNTLAGNKPDSKLTLRWTVNNPDSDTLRYRVKFRQENQTVWRDVFPDQQVLTKTEWAWDTLGVPDGFYIVQVEGSDEMSNPKELVLRFQEVSTPIRVDNHAPTFTKLGYKAGILSGSVADHVGPISQLEYSLDGGDWHPCTSTDGMLDSKTESFRVQVEAKVSPPHIVAVRATDSVGHAVVSEIFVKP